MYIIKFRYEKKIHCVLSLRIKILSLSYYWKLITLFNITRVKNTKEIEMRKRIVILLFLFHKYFKINYRVNKFYNDSKIIF